MHANRLRPPSSSPSRRARAAGFTLIELMIAVAIVGILAAIAFPSYARYVMRSRSLVALTTLSTMSIALEQRFQDVGNYGSGGCGTLPLPPTADFTFACVLGSPGNPAGFTVTATGTGTLVGLAYSLDDAGRRRTLAHPYGVPASDCWTIRGGTCDS